MTDTAPRRIKEEAYVTCLSCGKTSPQFVIKNEDGSLAATATCPKCSNVAHTNNLAGLWGLMREAAKKIAQINLDMIDLQDDGEER